MIITIDGSSGTGKSTVAKRVAQRLGFAFFDTGAMYRSVAWFLLQKKIPLSDTGGIENILPSFSFSIETSGDKKRYLACGSDVTDAIRTLSVTKMASEAAALPAVRKALWAIQRSFAENGNAVFEGRDMGTVVFPDADLKIFLKAAPEVRAQRRLSELIEKYPNEYSSLDYEKILAELLSRDAFDSHRKLAPLKCPEDALVIDTSFLSIDEVVDKILEYKKELL
jgi:cytidylate kinase